MEESEGESEGVRETVIVTRSDGCVYRKGFARINGAV